MLKLVSHCLEAQADMMLHVCKHCRQHAERDHRLKEMAQIGHPDTMPVLPTFVFIGKLLRDL
jgi:heterodisulfide reductase subunit B